MFNSFFLPSLDTSKLISTFWILASITAFFWLAVIISEVPLVLEISCWRRSQKFGRPNVGFKIFHNMSPGTIVFEDRRSESFVVGSPIGGPFLRMETV